MNARFRTYVVAAASAALVAWAVWWPGLNYLGYCRDYQRFLSRDEEIAFGIDAALGSYPPVIDVYEESAGSRTRVGVSRPADPVRYADSDEFKRLNPNCCEVTEAGRKNYQAPLSYRVYGSVRNYVHLAFLVRYRDSDGDLIEQPTETWYAIANCGRAWNGI